jgi:hypothetical protein
VRENYYKDTRTPGPQSKILEGTTWEEASRLRVRTAAKMFNWYWLHHYWAVLFSLSYHLFHELLSISKTDPLFNNDNYWYPGLVNSVGKQTHALSEALPLHHRTPLNAYLLTLNFINPTCTSFHFTLPVSNTLLVVSNGNIIFLGMSINLNIHLNIRQNVLNDIAFLNSSGVWNSTWVNRLILCFLSLFSL